MEVSLSFLVLALHTMRIGFMSLLERAAFCSAEIP